MNKEQRQQLINFIRHVKDGSALRCAIAVNLLEGGGDDIHPEV